MAQIKPYQSFFGFESEKAIYDAFSASLLPTNRTYNFFVDWKKVQDNLKKVKIEIGILGTLTHARDFEKELEEVLLQYPKTAKVLPLLIATRDVQLEILDDEKSRRVDRFDFTKAPSRDEVQRILQFVKKTGIASQLFKRIKVLHDYLYGVEVGLDSNARKNRSGSFMERVIGQTLQDIQRSVKDVEIFPKGTFTTLADTYQLQIPRQLRQRTPDFAVRKGKKLLSIEVNFYSG